MLWRRLDVQCANLTFAVSLAQAKENVHIEFESSRNLCHVWTGISILMILSQSNMEYCSSNDPMCSSYEDYFGQHRRAGITVHTQI